MAVRAKLTAEPLPRLPVGLPFESSRVFALMPVLQLVEHVKDALLPHITRQVRWRVSVDDFFGAFFDETEVRHIASTILPLDPAHVAEFSATFTTKNHQ